MSYLADLLDSTRARLEESKTKVSSDEMEQRLAAIDKPRSFATALRGPGIAIIAEIKRASPSTGELNANLGASQAAAAYAEGGAAAISVLTEPDFFKGQLEDLASARGAGLPLLRKDFILDPWQVLESRAAQADALLLIARVLDDRALMGLLAATNALEMEAVVEVHDDADLDRAFEAGAAIIGVNHRDLDTFEVDPDRTAKLAPRVPADRLLITLSGVSSAEDVRRAHEAGAGAVLVGEALVTTDDPVAKLKELAGTGGP